MILLLANMVYGLLFGDFNAEATRLRAAHQQLEELRRGGSAVDPAGLTAAKADFDRISGETRSIRQHAEYHKLLGLAAAVVTLLVNSISVTYFIGTSRWCQEVVDTYQLAPGLIAASKQLKRRTFPWSLLGMLAILAIGGCGAAADPLNSLPSSAQWVTPHLCIAVVGIGVIGWSFIMQLANMQANLTTINQIMEEVKIVRGQKRLEPGPETDPETDPEPGLEPGHDAVSNARR